jgi:F0F1-type ATP synthase alpha subunit
MTEIPKFEAKWLEFMKANHADILKEISVTSAISKESEEALHTAMATFTGENEFAMR